ncbi:PTS sugar transporter subunit IIC, partial [Romboutsia sp. 13368]|uniref:PTS sugar transporter subunit IIC n=1 Tax=Romboutsia sp. 13368 TaxID=2708053 RepID=UPI002ED15AD3
MTQILIGTALLLVVLELFTLFSYKVLQGMKAMGSLAVFGSSFMNYVFFSKMKFGSKKDTIALAIEPLTQSDIISANPIPVYVTNFIGGAMSGIIVAIMGIQVGT